MASQQKGYFYMMCFDVCSIANSPYVGAYHKIWEEKRDFREKSAQSDHPGGGARNKIFASNESDAERNAPDRR